MGDILPVEVPPGYVKVDSALAERGRYIDGFGVRFFRGKPQKVGGWVSMLTASLLGIVRGLKTWNDLTSQEWIAAGTTQKLYAITNSSFAPQDITPFISSLAATNPFTTTNGSKNVNVAWTGHLAVVGQVFYIPTNVTVGGMTLTAGEYPISAIVDNNNFTIIGPTNATSGATGGGSITISLEIPPGLVSPSSGFGWGAGSWGAETWGTARSLGSISFDPLAWSLSNFGKILLASPSGGALYSWDPTNVGQPRAIKVAGTTPVGSPTAPPSTMSGFFTTAERFVIAFGINGNLMQFQWCGQGDFTDWDATALTGSVGSPSRIRNITRGRKIMGGVDIGGFVSLIWTDSAVYTHQYTGSANVFNTLLAGVDCGLIGPAAYVVVGTTAYWMSSGGFFRCAGGAAPEKIPGSEDISEWFFQNLRKYYSIQSFAWYNARFGEVSFAFCSNGSTQPDTLVIYNAEHGYWFTDKIVRTASARFDGQDSRPILAGADGQLYQHDEGVDANGSPLPWSITTALLELESGQVSFGVDTFYPDMQRHVGTISLTFTAYDRTPDPVLDTQTKTFVPGDSQADFRVSGRDLSMTMSGGTALGDDFRLGSPKVELTKSGRRG